MIRARLVAEQGQEEWMRSPLSLAESVGCSLCQNIKVLTVAMNFRPASRYTKAYTADASGIQQPPRKGPGVG